MSRVCNGGRAAGLLTAMLVFGGSAVAQKSIDTPDEPVVGESRSIAVIPDLQNAREMAGGRLWTRTISVRGASFLKAHLVNVNLRAGDVLTIRNSQGRVVENITGRGPKNWGTFWALSSFGDEMTLELRVRHEYGYLPFRVDEVIVGNGQIFSTPGDSDGPESICSPGDFEDVQCYQSDAAKWANVLASVGVMSVGGNPNTALFCSGCNVSPLNYVLTNDHCIETQAQCDSSEFVFKFYRQGCNDGSPVTPDWQSFRCDDIVASSPFISCDQGLADLDYALCSVIGDPAATFGFAEVDPNPLTDGEAIYIIQHPAGRPHEITHGSGSDVDVDGTVLRYYSTLDTEGGSSGSPVFRESDDKVIGLHHCGGCSTPGTGNRGMLMSDIYPEIEGFLCTPSLEIVAASITTPVEVSGNGDTIMHPGEVWQVTPSVRNSACADDATNVTADMQVNGGSAAVTLLDTVASFGNVNAGESASSASPVRFRIGSTVACGSDVILDVINITANEGGPFTDAPNAFHQKTGEAPFITEYTDDYSSGLGAWTIVDGGTGAGAAQTWTDGNPGGRTLGLTAPYVIVDSDNHGTGLDMDEELISQTIDVSTYSIVELQFDHEFRWWSGGNDEQCDVDVRSSLTGGAWVNVANYSGGDASGNVLLDITAQAAGASDLQVRFHYYQANFEWWWAIDDVFVLGSNGFECDNGSFALFGTGCVGTGGQTPILEGLGSATPDAELTIQVRDGLSNGLGLLLWSTTDNPSASPCVFQIGFPTFLTMVINLDSSGEWSITGLSPPVLSSTHAYLQFLGKDSGAAVGKFTFSNGLDMFIQD